VTEIDALAARALPGTSVASFEELTNARTLPAFPCPSSSFTTSAATSSTATTSSSAGSEHERIVAWAAEQLEADLDRLGGEWFPSVSRE
jgi:hypothetical protein